MAVLGVIVAAIYLLWAYQQVFHGVPKPADEKTRDLAWPERLVMAPLIILIVFLGVYPKPVLDRIDPSVNQLVAHVEKATGHDQPAVATKGTRRRWRASHDHRHCWRRHHGGGEPPTRSPCRPSAT